MNRASDLLYASEAVQSSFLLYNAITIIAHLCRLYPTDSIAGTGTICLSSCPTRVSGEGVERRGRPQKHCMRPYVLVSDLVLANLGGMHSIKGRAVAKGGNRSIRTPNTRICCAVDVMPYQGKIVVSNGR